MLLELQKPSFFDMSRRGDSEFDSWCLEISAETCAHFPQHSVQLPAQSVGREFGEHMHDSLG